MAVYIKTFDNHSDYEEYIDGDDVKLPNVSVCKDMMTEVHYNEYDFRDQYLTFEALESGTFTLTIGSAITTTLLSSVSYSLDNGETWTTTNNVDGQTVTITTPTVNTGGKVLWKGTGTAMSTTTASAAAGRPHTSSMFTSTGLFDVYGNLLSMLYGDDFENEDSITGTYNFALIFYSYNTANTAKINSAENLCMRIKNVTDYCYFRMFQGVTTMIYPPKSIDAEIMGPYSCGSMFFGCLNMVKPSELPATTLSERSYNATFQSCSAITYTPELPATTLGEYCYYATFSKCSNLKRAKKLPATTLASSCYYGMFSECSSLIEAPELHATTLAQLCCRNMFYGCTSLKTAPYLPATALTYGCYVFMFSGCTSLTTVPGLPATTLAEACYQNMFTNCTSLKSAPELPATTLAETCYGLMFSGCINLTTVHDLPATTVVRQCYTGMFSGCTSLTTAPELPATTLVDDCYTNMFDGCTNLSHIKAMFTTEPSTGYTSNWVNGVSSTGTFIKNSAAQWDVTGVNGIPTNWTVQTASA